MCLVEKTFKNGEVIIKEGDNGSSFFLLLEGKVGVYSDYGKKDHFKLAVLEPGEYFGEMAILETYPRSATIAAKGAVRVIEIPGNRLNDYLAENPDQILELMKHLGTRVQTMTKDLNEAKALLKEVRESDEAKKNKSFISKIKKHIDLYQHNKNKITEPNGDSLREAFAGLKDDGADTIKSYRKGMFVFREGKADNCIYILHSGTVGFYSNYRTREEEQIDELKAVTIFGESGMLEEETRTSTAVVESDEARVESIRPEDLEQMIGKCPAKVIAILRHLSYRLRLLNIEFLSTCREITETYNNK